MQGQYAVIGDPIAQSLSPAMMKAAFAATGIVTTYEAIRVPPDELRDFIVRARMEHFAGFNVTTPLKESIIHYLDDLTEDARIVNAVNTVRRDVVKLIGHNTDGSGFLEALEQVWQWKPKGASALLLGSGPAARAIAHRLVEAGAVQVSCWSRNEETARWIGPPPHRPPDLLVSTLPPTAMVPDEVLEYVARNTLVFDVNYNATRSPIPPSLGARRTNGLPMLLYQGAQSFEWWTGKAAPLDVMRRAIGLP